MTLKIVITTIQEPTDSVLLLASHQSLQNVELIIIGDQKGPKSWNAEHSNFYSIEQQLQMPFKLAGSLPKGSYSRKNLGYLAAFQAKATCIFETDDDNAPLTNWAVRQLRLTARKVNFAGWVNVYHYFTHEHIWPRGFPLTEIARAAEKELLFQPAAELDAPIQQGLANGSPDVDAVWRLLMDQDIQFYNNDSVYLPKGAWSPFNSQSTWWFPEAYPLMYLPSHVSFRMTDIWRSFVAQRCLWELGYGLVFHGPEMVQERNYHDLQQDFEQEIPGYLLNDRIRIILESTKLLSGKQNILSNMYTCYAVLVENKIMPSEELTLVKAWVEDIESLSLKC